ncbi:hypothetical protein HWV62_13383, partial [Athelia sp. TMB]
MFFNAFIASSVVLAMISQVYGHAAISPPLGVKVSGTISSLLATSSAVAANGNSFTTTITNFNGGQDGSTQVTAQIDPTGVGKTFTALTVTKNGVLAPAAAGSQQITVALPAGTKCTGGANKDTCLVAFKTAGGFGNCIGVTQGNAAVAAAGSASATSAKVVKTAAVAAAAANPTAAAAAASTSAATGGSGACAAVAAAKDAKAEGKHHKASAAAAATPAAAAKSE